MFRNSQIPSSTPQYSPHLTPSQQLVSRKDLLTLEDEDDCLLGLAFTWRPGRADVWVRGDGGGGRDGCISRCGEMKGGSRFAGERAEGEYMKDAIVDTRAAYPVYAHGVCGRCTGAYRGRLRPKRTRSGERRRDVLFSNVCLSLPRLYTATVAPECSCRCVFMTYGRQWASWWRPLSWSACASASRSERYMPFRCLGMLWQHFEPLQGFIDDYNIRHNICMLSKSSVMFLQSLKVHNCYVCLAKCVKKLWIPCQDLPLLKRFGTVSQRICESCARA